jgi:hypothetical protein
MPKFAANTAPFSLKSRKSIAFPSTMLPGRHDASPNPGSGGCNILKDCMKDVCNGMGYPFDEMARNIGAVLEGRGTSSLTFIWLRPEHGECV